MAIIIKLFVTIILLSYFSEALYVHRIRHHNADMPKTIQFCRKSCLKKFINEKAITAENTDKCSGNSMCFMCWDYCGLLYHESRLVTVSMCSDFVCYSGCKSACTYYTMIHKANVENSQRKSVLEKKMHYQQQAMEAKLLT